MPESSDKKIVPFLHDTCPAVYSFLIVVGVAFSITSSETIVVGLAGPVVWNTFVINRLRQKASRRGRRQKEYSDTFENLLCSAITQLIEDVRQSTEYWHLDEFEVDAKSSFLDLRRKFVIDILCAAASIVTRPSLSTAFPAIDTYWFSTFVSRNFGDIQDSYIV